MATVGLDKRLNYYQMTGDAVIAELASHRYGLTLPEAQRRLKDNGSNIVHATRISHKFIATQPWVAGLLAVGFCGALYVDDQHLALAFLLLGGLSILAEWWREHTADNLEYHIHRLLPTKATVRRNDQVSIINAAEVVVGDIVVLEPGARIPADLRLVHSDHLVVDESVLFGGNRHELKYHHEVATVLPVHHRHNQAFAGTTVMSGSGWGIVTATGIHLELGRILTQAELIPRKTSHTLAKLAQLTRRFSALGLLWLAVVLAFVAFTDLTALRGALFAVTGIAALVPVALGIAISRSLASFNRRSKQHLSALRISAIDRLGSANIALLDEQNLLLNPIQTVQDVYTSKKHYRLEKPSLDPVGTLLNDKTKPVSKKALADLQPLLDAVALSTQSRLLPPDDSHETWHVHGPANEGALIALAAQAGTDIAAVREQNPFVSRHTFDHSRLTTSAIHSYKKREYVFVYGESQAVLDKVISVSEGGHTRKLTKADRADYEAYREAQTHLGNHVVAIASRQLATKENAMALTHQQAEQGLTLLGLISIGQAVQPKTATSLNTLSKAGVAVSVLSNRPAYLSVSLLKRLGGKQPIHLDTRDVAELDDDQLLARLASGNVVLTNLSPEQRLRLVNITEGTGNSVMIAGSGLSDVASMRRASVSLVSAKLDQSTTSEADFSLRSARLSDIVAGFKRSRHLNTHIDRILHSAITDHSLLFWLVAVSFVLYLIGHIPLVTTALLLLVSASIQGVAYSAIGDDPAEHDHKPTDLLPHPALVNSILGVFAGMLVSANFLFYFVRQGLSPNYIDGLSNLFLHAATLSFVSIVLCMWINIVFSRSQHGNNNLWRQLSNTSLLKGWVVSIAALVAVVYVPQLQQLAGSRALSIADWLCALLVASMYLLVRLVADGERRSSRHHIIALHQEVHGKDATPQI